MFVVVADPIGSGFASDLAHPDRNVTGFANLFSPLAANWLQLLKEIAPGTKRVALLFNPRTLAPLPSFMSSILTAAAALGIEISITPVYAKEEIEGVVAAQANNTWGRDHRHAGRV